MEEENEIYYGTCKFCGRRVFTSRYETQEQADEQVTSTCTCDKAKDLKFKKDQEKEREKNIQTIKTKLKEFKDYCQERNIEFDEDLQGLTLKLGIAVLDGQFKSLSIKHGSGRIKLTIKEKAKGGIVIKLSYDDSKYIEV